ncbi:MAG: fibrillarin-like rRNA/tRNA 2'-O-methyltransferase [Pyrobaculum sp.]
MAVEVVEVRPHPLHHGVYVVKFEDGVERLATKNLTPGRRVYGERLVKWGGVEYREWNPYRSKLAAAIWNGLKFVPIREGTHMLYLGAASGTTPSHISDMVGESGLIYSVEFSPRVFREFVEKLIDQGRRNLVPILGDARFPYQYAHYVKGVDVAYIDVAQPAQAKILADNADYFLKPGGHVMLVIKAMSIDVTAPASETFRQEINTLKERRFEILETVHLEPYDTAHAMVIARR